MNIFDREIIFHQKFSKSNLSIDIYYSNDGWAIVSPTSDFKIIIHNNSIYVKINSISFFIKTKNISRKYNSIKACDGSYIFFNE